MSRQNYTVTPKMASTNYETKQNARNTFRMIAIYKSYTFSTPNTLRAQNVLSREKLLAFTLKMRGNDEARKLLPTACGYLGAVECLAFCNLSREVRARFLQQKNEKQAPMLRFVALRLVCRRAVS